MIDIGSYLALLKSSAPLLNNKPIDDNQAFDIFRAVHDEAFSGFFRWSNKLYFLCNELANIYGNDNVYTGNNGNGDVVVSEWADNYDTRVCDPIVMDLVKILGHYFPEPSDKLKECKFEVMGTSIQYILTDNQLVDPIKDKQYIRVGGLTFHDTQANDIITKSSKVIVGGKAFDHNAWQAGIVLNHANKAQQPAIIPVQKMVFDTTELVGNDQDTLLSIGSMLNHLNNHSIRNVSMTIYAVSVEAYNKYRSMIHACNEMLGINITTTYSEKKPWSEQLRSAMEFTDNRVKSQQVTDTIVTAKAIEELRAIRERILSRRKVTDYDQKSIMLVTPDVFKTSVDINVFLYRISNDRDYYRNNSVLNGLPPQVFNQNEIILLVAIDEYILANEMDERTLNYLS